VGDDATVVDISGTEVPEAWVHPNARKTSAIPSHIRSDFVNDMIVSVTFTHAVLANWIRHKLLKWDSQPLSQSL
jgi:hypothetical protein